uniref:F-box domain-containing protein n=1 Tax=Parastrongyloides trichosuri TaxID=131310 RepID=A0A0N5A2I8_PARTI
MTPTLKITDLPRKVIIKISQLLPPIDRLNLEATNKQLRYLSKSWDDIGTILIKKYINEPDCYTIKVETKRKNKNTIVNNYIKQKSIITVYHVQLTTFDGTIYTLYTDPLRKVNIRCFDCIFERCKSADKLIIFNCSLNDYIIPSLYFIERSIKVLKLWNCEDYFDKNRKPCQLIKELFSFPNLKSLMILSTVRPKYATLKDHNICDYTLHPVIVSFIRAPIEELQLTNLNIPVKTFKILSIRLRKTLERLSIGCTYGKSKKINTYAKALSCYENLKDLDLPPFLFSIKEDYLININIYNAITKTNVKTLGFRHYNTSNLFKFIRNDLPPEIKVIRVFHNPSRIPNFKQLGMGTCEKKISVTSKISRNSITSSSNNSIVGSYGRSIFKALRIKRKVYLDDLPPSQSPRSSGLYSINEDGGNLNKKGIGNLIPTKELCIFAIEESCRSVEKLIHKKYNNIDVYYTSDIIKYQEVVGKMASPMPLNYPLKPGTTINQQLPDVKEINSISSQSSDKTINFTKPVGKFFNLIKF